VFVTEMRIAFPDQHVDVETLVADDDQVAFAYTLTGTHHGPFRGTRSDRQVRQGPRHADQNLAGGKMTERWGSSDEFGILTQLGLH
jgi:predicted ester cyclase